MLKTKFDSLTEQSTWDDVKAQIENDNDYLALSTELDRLRLFDEHHRQVVAEAQAAAAVLLLIIHIIIIKKARKEKKKRKHEKSNSSNTAPVSVSDEM